MKPVRSNVKFAKENRKKSFKTMSFFSIRPLVYRIIFTTKYYPYASGYFSSDGRYLNNSVSVEGLLANSFIPEQIVDDVLNRQQNKVKNRTTIVPKKEVIFVLPYLGVQSKIVTKQLKTCINKFYVCINLRVIFQSGYRVRSLVHYKDRINRFQLSKVVYKASCCRKT